MNFQLPCIKTKLLFGLSVFMLSSGLTAQTTHTVLNTDDSGAGSLRDIITDANTNNGDTIRFDESLIANGNVTITLNSEIAFSKALNFKGLYNSSDTLKISGGNNNRIFNITNAGKTVIDSLVLIDGYAGTFGSGGAIYRYNCTDTLWILNSIISGNTAVDSGGGIYTSSDVSVTAVVINNSKVMGNTANNGNGGGVHSTSTSFSSHVIVNNSTISMNTAQDVGGGLSSSSPSSTIIVNNSTLTGNTAYNGGALGSFSLVLSGPESTSSSITINYSTITGNSANSKGGGIYSGSISDTGTPGSTASSSVFINNSTIFNNTAVESGGGAHSFASSAFSAESSSIDILSSIVAYNETNSIASSSGIFNNLSPDINSAGYNIFSDLQADADGSDQMNVTESDLNLQPLALNGGATKTIKPGIASVAINAGDPTNTNPAQNGNINGVRDCGAAEACISIASFSVVSCGDYTVPSGDETYTTSGIVIDTIQNIAGCDSVMTINLTIGQPNTGDTTAVVCGSFIWYGTEYTTSGTPTHTLQNMVGCDSVVTLDLTINDVDLTTTNTGFEISANNTNATSYQWINCDDNNSIITGATEVNYTATENGNYAVIIVDGACTDTSDCVTVAGLGINNNSFANLQLYPNPSNGEFIITTTENNVNVTVYGLDGKVILDNVMITNNQKTINLKGIESGVYFVKVSNQENQKTLRLIIK